MRMKAEILIFSLDILFDVSVGQAEFTPMETSVTRLLDVARRNVSVDGISSFVTDKERVLQRKQETASLRWWQFTNHTLTGDCLVLRPYG